MNLLKKIFEEGDMFMTGLVVFVGIPFFGAFLMGHNFRNFSLEIALASVVYTIIFVWIMKGGLSKIRKKR